MLASSKEDSMIEFNIFEQFGSYYFSDLNEFSRKWVYSFFGREYSDWREKHFLLNMLAKLGLRQRRNTFIRKVFDFIQKWNSIVTVKLGYLFQNASGLLERPDHSKRNLELRDWLAKAKQNKKQEKRDFFFLAFPMTDHSGASLSRSLAIYELSVVKLSACRSALPCSGSSCCMKNHIYSNL